ncbi:TnpV protein [Enterocloster clostridioformis]|uniref:TnpV protein n=1 Tax=Enterocloster clostridioformis TaxID=1531 RepID=UPI0015711231|nr:TnpV protein [Enterocloster clostridioformis]NSJ40340.1 TnpV protein [Enterocloster clostridioformis]
MEINYKKSVIHQTVGGEDMETEVILPDFGDGQKQRPIGIWGQRHLRYIREHRIALYTELLTSGRLNAYLADLNEEAEAMLFRLVKELAEKEGVTEKLKAEDGMKWVQAMNNIRNRAAEVVYNDLIYN